MTRVFPLPAPAKISTGPSVVSTASRCCGFRSSRNDKRECSEFSTRILQEKQGEDFKLDTLNHGQFPSKSPELCQLSKISLIGCDNANAHSRRAHRNQGIICQTSLPDLLVAVFGR